MCTFADYLYNFGIIFIIFGVIENILSTIMIKTWMLKFSIPTRLFLCLAICNSTYLTANYITRFTEFKCTISICDDDDHSWTGLGYLS